MNYTFRKCTYDDLEFIFELKVLCLKYIIEKVYGWDDKDQKEKTKRELDRMINDMRIIMVDGKDVGVTTFIKHNDYYNLGLTMIHPRYQGKGIGGDIINTYIKETKKYNKEIVLKVFKDNKAQELYKRLGFKTYEDDENYLYMKL